ncbi:MAG: hypothetical protein AB7T14_05830 [Candidatus Methylacidiphilaceae bacterium]
MTCRSDGWICEMKPAPEKRRRALLSGRQSMPALESRPLRFLVGAAVAGYLWAVQTARAEEAAPAPERRVVRFNALSALEAKEGPHPKDVWVYGRFRARTPVSGGVFLARVEGENFGFQRAVFRAKIPLPEIRRGTKVAIPKTQPAKLIEVAKVDGIIALLTLAEVPMIKSQKRDVRRSQASEAGTSSGYPPQRLVPFHKLKSIAKKEGVHPQNLWTWGKFSAFSNLREGVVTAMPAGLKTRRTVESLAIGWGERLQRVIFHFHEPRAIRKGALIDVPKENPARVKRIFLSRGVLVWLDVDPPAPAALPDQLESD